MEKLKLEFGKTDIQITKFTTGYVILFFIMWSFLVGCYDVNTFDLPVTEGISSVRVFYPADDQSHTAVLLSGGFRNSKEDMYWLADYLSENGIIVFAISAVNNVMITGYEKAHKNGVKLIKEQNNDVSSPIYKRVNNIGLIGYSMGGGAVLNVADELGDEIDVVVSLAPFSPDLKLKNVKASTLILAGSLDTLASPVLFAKPAYAHLPETVNKACGIVSGATHDSWKSEMENPAILLTAWIKYFADGQESYYTTIENPPIGISYYKENLN